MREKHGTSSCLKILHPAAFSLKEVRFLATHPRRVFGYPEKERKGKEAGKLKASRQKETLLIKEMKMLQCLSGDFIDKPPLQITKNYNSKHYYKEKVGRKQKREKEVKNSNWRQEQSIGVKT